ncbi:NAC domain-containing protein 82-like isoform X2 [Lycium barbarum]|uniref:NAC domain-containing protein 82-like isoform X2 n=1 Tax=Lycium barbarum TaxID=112863 RepID=UPI00293E3E30|nr:NAC domain-containing protein 82-like isoform X2 [Lycium barbarum]
MRLAPGFRFHPTDVELIMYYLKRKNMGKELLFKGITELNIYDFSPEDLPDKCLYKSKDREWYFFCPTKRKYASGVRMNRSTGTGYWKTTGKDRSITSDGRSVGSVKTLIFHRGQSPNGLRTDWVLHEYKFEDKELIDAGFAQDYVLCKVFQKSGPGPKNGAQYGAPFKEEDWEDAKIPSEPCTSDVFPVDEEVPGQLNSSYSFSPLLILPEKQSCPVGPSMVNPVSGPTNEMPPDEQGDEIDGLLDIFTEDPTLLSAGNETNQNLENFNQDVNGPPAPSTDENDIFDGLGDIDHRAGVGQSRSDLSASGGANYSLNPMILPEDAYMELDDFEIPLNSCADTIGTGQLMLGDFCAPYNSNNDMQQLCFGSNSLGTVHQDFVGHHLPMLPESYKEQVNDSDTVYNFQNNVSQDCNAAADYNVSSYKQPEESRFDTLNLERGVQQRKFCLSIFALCDDSFILVKAEVTLGVDGCTNDALSVIPGEQRYFYSSIFALCGGSFILVKAEVTLGFDGCTNDALSVIPGEQRYFYSSIFALCGGSFILVKAEVTLGFDGCTNEALSVILGEQRKLYLSIFALCGGSFILVKAEVTLGVDGCTNEALSVILGDPSCTFTCHSNVDKADFSEEMHEAFCFGFSLAFIFSSHLKRVWFNTSWELYEFIFLKILLNPLQFNSGGMSFHLHFPYKRTMQCSEFDKHGVASVRKCTTVNVSNPFSFLVLR